jgi:peptide/nickel transport system substrate-binding protein
MSGFKSVLIAGVLWLTWAGSSAGVTFRWANDGDASSMDPYARAETFLLTFAANIYEPLVQHDRAMKLSPALATSWTQVAATVWRFELRQGVRFHDGQPFTADDVIFSYGRAKGAGSDLAYTLASVKEVRKVDDFTVELETKGPDPILPASLRSVGIMSRSWASAHDAAHVAELNKAEENFATRHANGTGPFILHERSPDQRTVLVRNPDWWAQPEHNLDEVVFLRVANNATRVAALLSGELDMIYAVPPQDTDRISRTPGLRIVQTPEMRTIYLGFDQARAELLESSVKGENPFKDVRVRRAFYQAIDIEAIHGKVMRGFSRPIGTLVAPAVSGFDEDLDHRYPFDPAAAKHLLAEAGYPNGFEIGFDCPNDRYVADEQICQAIAAMLARVGVKANLLAQTRAKFFGKIGPPDFRTSFFMLGWTPTTLDAHNTLLSVAATRRPDRSMGGTNYGGYSSPELDTLIGRIQVELDGAERQRLISSALRVVKEDFAYIPLHAQTIVWAARDTIELVQLANNTFPLRYVRKK